jgi:hypothetical protein
MLRRKFGPRREEMTWLEKIMFFKEGIRVIKSRQIKYKFL